MTSSYQITVEIGGMPILLHTQDDSFRQMLARRYAGFVDSAAPPRFEFDIELTTPSRKAPDEDVRVEMQDGTWRLRRGDFRAHWNPEAGRGRIRQSANPYSIDSVLRIVHTLILARGRRLSAALRRSHPQRTSFSVLRSVRRRENHHLTAGADGRDPADR